MSEDVFGELFRTASVEMAKHTEVTLEEMFGELGPIYFDDLPQAVDNLTTVINLLFNKMSEAPGESGGEVAMRFRQALALLFYAVEAAKNAAQLNEALTNMVNNTDTILHSIGAHDQYHAEARRLWGQAFLSHAGGPNG